MKRMAAILCALLLAGCGQTAALPAEGTAPGPALPGRPAAVPDDAQAAAVAPDWTPTEPVTLIVAYKEGSSTDQGARLLAQYAEPYIGQPVRIRNIAANSGMTAWETLAASPADGTVLGFINMPNIFSAIENGAAFTMQDLAPVCNHVVETSVVAVSAASPYQTLEDLLVANRAASQAGTYLRAATNGVQASNDIGATLLAYTSGGWKFRHVSYGSTTDQVNALFSGECDWAVLKVSDVMPYLPPETPPDGAAAPEPTSEPTPGPAPGQEEGAPEGTPAPEQAAAPQYLRVLGVFDTDRAQELPDVPTLDEQGYPTGWYGSRRGIVAPAGTDPIILDYYAEAFRRAMADPKCREAHREAGFSLYYLDRTAFANLIDERERFNHSLLPRLFAN